MQRRTRKRPSVSQQAVDLKNKTINKLQGAGESVRNKVEETMEGVAPFARARGALDEVLNFDQRYADRVKRDMGGEEKRPMGVLLGGSSVRELFADPIETDTTLGRVMGNTVRAGATATNLGYRYGLPAAGVTLAGKALYDLTFGNEADQQEQGQLPLY